MKMGLLYIFHCHGYFNCYKATWNIDTMNQMRNVFDIINMKKTYDKLCEWKFVTGCLEVVIYQLSYNAGRATC